MIIPVQIIVVSFSFCLMFVIITVMINFWSPHIEMHFISSSPPLSLSLPLSLPQALFVCLFLDHQTAKQEYKFESLDRQDYLTYWHAIVCFFQFQYPSIEMAFSCQIINELIDVLLCWVECRIKYLSRTRGDTRSQRQHLLPLSAIFDLAKPLAKS